MNFNLQDYEPVEARLARFWEGHPTGRVFTRMVSFEEGQVVFYAEIYRDLNDELPAATGYAHEVVTQRGVNSTSAVENCETSAIGRALANAGYATKAKRPSREEMVKASRQTLLPITEQVLADLRKAVDEADSIEVLNLAGTNAARYDLPADERNALREKFLARKKELDTAP